MSTTANSIFSNFFKERLFDSYLFNPNTPFKIFAIGTLISDTGESISLVFEDIVFAAASGNSVSSNAPVNLIIAADSRITGIVIVADETNLQTDLSVWNLNEPILFPDGGSLVINDVTFTMSNPS